MGVLGRFLAILGIAIALGYGSYLVTHASNGNVEYGWAKVGAGFGLAIGSIGSLLVYLAKRRARR